MSQAPKLTYLKSNYFVGLDENNEPWLALLEWNSVETHSYASCDGLELVKLNEVTDFMDHVTDPAAVLLQIDAFQFGDWSAKHYPEMSELGLELENDRQYAPPSSWKVEPNEETQKRARKILEVIKDEILASARLEAKWLLEGKCPNIDTHHYHGCSGDGQGCGLSHEGVEGSGDGISVFSEDHIFHLYSKKTYKTS